jgi:hypothetical protein
MTDLPEKKDPSGAPKQKSERPSGRWNPFASLRMPISPEERMALLKLPRPLRRPGERLNAAELERVGKARRRRSVLLALGAVVCVMLFVVLGWWLWPSAEPLRETRADAVLPQVIATHEAPPLLTSPQPTADHTAEPNAAATTRSEPNLPAPPTANTTAKPKPERVAPAGGRTLRSKPVPTSTSPAAATPDPAANDDGLWTKQRQ